MFPVTFSGLVRSSYSCSEQAPETAAAESLVNMVEYLFKGRFNRLLQETTRKVSCWTCEYYGPLYKDGETIEEVFNLSDRQMT